MYLSLLDVLSRFKLKCFQVKRILLISIAATHLLAVSYNKSVHTNQWIMSNCILSEAHCLPCGADNILLCRDHFALFKASFPKATAFASSESISHFPIREIAISRNTNCNELFFVKGQSIKWTKFHQSFHQIGEVPPKEIQIDNVINLRNWEKAFKWWEKVWKVNKKNFIPPSCILCSLQLWYVDTTFKLYHRYCLISKWLFCFTMK